MGKWPLELVQTTVLHHPQPLPCHHGRQSSSTSAELSQYLPTSPHHSRQNSSCKSPPIPPRRPYIMTSPSSNPMTVAPPTLLKLSPNSIGKKTLSLLSKISLFSLSSPRLGQVCLFVYLRFKYRRGVPTTVPTQVAQQTSLGSAFSQLLALLIE